MTSARPAISGAEAIPADDPACRAALEGNLARLRRHHREVAMAVEHAGDGACRVLRGPRGELTVAWRDVLLASAYDPRREGERLGAEMAREESDVMVTVGIGLAHHLESFRRARACPLIIYEPDAERLRATLRARPGLALLGAPDVVVAHSEEQLVRAVQHYYTVGLRLRVHPLPALTRAEPERVRRCLERVRRAKEAVDVTSGTRIRKLRSWATLVARNAGEIARTPGFEQLAPVLGGRPAVVVAAGPSLDKQLPLLAEYGDRFTVICIGQALGALRRAGIRPHLVHVVDSAPLLHQLERGGASEDVVLVANPDVHRSLFQAPVAARFVSTPAADRLGSWLADQLGWRLRVMGGATVAQAAVGLGVALAAPAILLIGQDLAFTSGRAYAAGSAYEEVEVSLDADGRYRTRGHGERRARLGRRGAARELCEDVVWVESWHGPEAERVPTSLAYSTFIHHYQSIGDSLRELGIALVNCTEGGARTPGTDHRAFAECLAEYAAAPADPRAAILRIAREWQPAPPSRLEAALLRVERALVRISAIARAGEEEAVRAERELRGVAAARQIEILRRLGRGERKLRVQLGEVPWVDALIQPELHEATARVRRSGGGPPTPEEAARESRFLFEASLRGMERARDTLAELRGALAGGATLKSLPGPSEHPEA